MSKETLPAVVHEHFAKANVLHTYVQKTLGQATQHALETGAELIAAKAAVPHGRWEEECSRQFDGSIRCAQFYMQFTRDFGSIKSAEKSALLMLESSLDGAAKAARKAAHPEKKKPKKPKADKPQIVDVNSDPFDDAFTEDNDETESEPTETPCPKGKDKSAGTPPKQYDRSSWFKQWEQAIGPVVRLVDKIAEGVSEKHDPHHEAAQEYLESATAEMAEWMGVK